MKLTISAQDKPAQKRGKFDYQLILTPIRFFENTGQRLAAVLI